MLTQLLHLCFKIQLRYCAGQIPSQGKKMWTLTLLHHTHTHTPQYQQRWLRWAAGWWPPRGSSRPRWSAPLPAALAWCRQCLIASAGSSLRVEGPPIASAYWWPDWSPPPDPWSHRAGSPPHSGDKGNEAVVFFSLLFKLYIFILKPICKNCNQENNNYFTVNSSLQVSKSIAQAVLI